jgi:hypothetical protein
MLDGDWSSDVCSSDLQSAVTAKTRDEVKAELRDAVRKGEVLAYGETTAMLKDVFPGNYRAQ